MRTFVLVTFALFGCTGSPTESVPSQPVEPVLMPPSPVVEDCTSGCNTLPLNTVGDVSYLTAADTTLTFDLFDNVCARLNVPADSKSVYLADGSSWHMSGCQVIDNRNIFGTHWGFTAGPPGVSSWLRIETVKIDYPGYCSLSCTEVTP